MLSYHVELRVAWAVQGQDQGVQRQLAFGALTIGGMGGGKKCSSKGNWPLHRPHGEVGGGGGQVFDSIGHRRKV